MHSGQVDDWAWPGKGIPKITTPKIKQYQHHRQTNQPGFYPAPAPHKPRHIANSPAVKPSPIAGVKGLANPL